MATAPQLLTRMGIWSGPSCAMDETDKADSTKPSRKKKVKIYTWYCGYCGCEFETTEYSQRYCNPTHKKYAQRERAKRRKVSPL